MSNLLSGLIVQSKDEFNEASAKKVAFVLSWMNDDPKAESLFHGFFDELREVTIRRETSLDRVHVFCLYVICQFMAILMAKGLKEVDINSSMLSDYYDIDNASDIPECMEKLEKACLKMMGMTSEKPHKSYSVPVRRCIEYIDRHYNEKIGLETICQNINYSTYYLSRLFLKETGLSINDYINSRKIVSSREMLQRGVPIKVVAQALNYSSPSYFIQRFRKETGITPKQFQTWVASHEKPAT